MATRIEIEGRLIGSGSPVYIVAEMSANHHQDFDEAERILHAAKAAGADAVKLQTYTADTMTIRCDADHFGIKGTLWDGRQLHELYQEACTPWEWFGPLKALARRLQLHLFSTPFDETAVEFLEAQGAPAYKVASFELVDLPLLRRVARTGKPIILSTGMGTREEIDEAVRTIREAGGGELALLKCTSAYPASPEEMDLRTIPDLAQSFGLPVGLSDHSMDTVVPVTAVALGACIIEKHFTITRGTLGPDSAFSLEPPEFEVMVNAVRTAERALGGARYGVSDSEAPSCIFRRSLFVVEDMQAGDRFTPNNVRSIRPAGGLHTRYLDEVLGRCARTSVTRGTPLEWDLVAD